MSSTTFFPLPVTGDPEAVALALETAQALWKKLDYVEAVRWLRRAVLAAEESGDDLRVVRLAAAAADISNALSAGGLAPGQNTSAGPVTSQSPPAAFRQPRSGPPPLPTRATWSAPPSVAPPSRHEPPLPPAEIEEPVLEPESAILQEVDPEDGEKTTTAVTSSSIPPSAAEPSGHEPPSPPAEIEEPVLEPESAILQEVDPEDGEKTTTPATSSSIRPSLAGSSGVSSVFPSSQVGTSSPSGGRVDGLRAFRVSVQRSSDGELTVRSLRDGDKLPAGAREAMLVFSGSTRTASSG